MLCMDKLPESTGDKLTAWGDEFQLSWGIRLDSPGGSSEPCWGRDSTECLIYRRGTIFRSRLPGMLVKNICTAGEVLRSTGHSTSLRFDNFAWRGMYCFAEPLSGELRYLVIL